MIMLEGGALQLQKSWGANGYLIPLGESYALVDPGMKFSARAVCAELAAAGVLASISHVLLTHYDFDHAGAALTLSTETGASVWIGHADADVLTGLRRPGTPFRTLTAALGRSKLPRPVYFLGESPGFPAAITVEPTPGHTPGHFAFLWDRTLFCGDAVIVRRDGTLRPFPSIMNTDKPAALASAAVLKALDVDWICPGHGKVTARHSS